MRTFVLCISAFFALPLVACGGESGSDPVDAGPPPTPECALDSDYEKTPGYPYDPEVFRTAVWPILDASCGSAGCHAGPNGAGAYSVFSVSDDYCDFVNSFNEAYQKSDHVNDPANSRIYAAVAGGKPSHPSLVDSAPDELQAILDYVTAGYNRAQEDVSTNPAPLFDLQVYQTDVQPAFDSNGCLRSGCHDDQSAVAGFGLVPTPALDSDDMRSNLEAVVRLVDVTNGRDGVANSRIYLRVSDNHASSVFGDIAKEKLLAWMQAAVPNEDQTPQLCSDVGKFNVEVFADEILPVLDGLDLNDREGGRNTTGCMRGPCHGSQQMNQPGKLFLDPELPAAENLERFSCFVNLQNPSASRVLACPLDLAACQLPQGHPGQDVFAGVTDRNYQRILSYLYASSNDGTPLDFAFFARRINPIFDDRNAVLDGALNQSCSSTAGCHGVTSPDAPPPNLSNFAILPEVADEARLLLNFASAANFTFFPDPVQSSLFLYPTNQSVNQDDFDQATGLAHPVEAFAVDSVQALTILKWAGGLQPDGDGFLRDWLVAGDFPASDINTATGIAEATIEPRIFDSANTSTQFNNGEWDGLFSANAFVDLNDPDEGFPRAVGVDRIAYAVAYLINADSRDREVLFQFTSPNEVEVHIAGQIIPALPNQTATARVFLPAYQQDKAVTRILVKVFQQAADEQFGFQIQALDAGNQQPIVEGDGELLIKLSPEGGV